jgi:transposase
MNEIKLYCGIDVSCQTIDLCMQTNDNTFIEQSLANSTLGFKKLMQLTKGQSYHFVMESTGIYHLPLCFFLEEKQQLYSVVNALQIKRFIQMHLERNKSDKKDAKHICQYGIERSPGLYQMPDNLYFECRSLNNAIETITQEITSFTNKIHALKKLNLDDKTVLKSYEKIVKELKIELSKLETQLRLKLISWQPKMVELLSSITGIGKRATSILIVSTQGFKYTNSYQQLISFAGLSPKEYSSGSSIRGKVRICKQGGSKLRHTLYMCALNAKKTNPACKQLFDRLVAQGKNKKLAIIAVCNKLLKQVFGVIKSGKPYSKNHMLNLS